MEVRGIFDAENGNESCRDTCLQIQSCGVMIFLDCKLSRCCDAVNLNLTSSENPSPNQDLIGDVTLTTGYASYVYI
jgi:hypothetical protein